MLVPVAALAWVVAHASAAGGGSCTSVSTGSCAPALLQKYRESAKAMIEDESENNSKHNGAHTRGNHVEVPEDSRPENIDLQQHLRDRTASDDGVNTTSDFRESRSVDAQ